MKGSEDKVQKIYCQFCGKRLPADILHTEGKVRLLVVCPHCKGRNVVEKENIQ